MSSFLRRAIGNALIWLEDVKDEARVARCKLNLEDGHRHMQRDVVVGLKLDASDFNAGLEATFAKLKAARDAGENWT